MEFKNYRSLFACYFASLVVTILFFVYNDAKSKIRRSLKGLSWKDRSKLCRSWFRRNKKSHTSIFEKEGGK